jgi:hypothetical protein
MRNLIFKYKGIRRKATSYRKGSGEEIIFHLYDTDIVII